jgi:membrane protease YdiL (CAAX protease family)
MLSVFYNRRQRRFRCAIRLVLQSWMMIAMIVGSIIPLTEFWRWLGHSTSSPMFLAAMGFIQASAVAASVLLASWLIDRRDAGFTAATYGWQRWCWSELAIGFALGGGAMLAIFGIELALGWIQVQPFRERSLTQLGHFLSYFLVTLTLFLAVGISEELLSRGYQLKNLAEGLRGCGKRSSVAMATLLSSLVFGGLHAFNEHSTMVSCLSVSLAGMMLATGRIVFGNLAAPIGIHVAWNLFQGPILGFPVSGNVIPGGPIELVQAGPAVWTGGQFGPEAGLIGVLAVVVLWCILLGWGSRRKTFSREMARLTRLPRCRRVASCGPGLAKQNSV